MRPIAAALLAVALLAPATAFACGMPMRVAEKVELSDLMAAIDEAEEPAEDAVVQEAPAEEAAVAEVEPAEEPAQAQAVEPAPAPAS